MSKIPPETSQTVIKHSAAIQIQNNITLLQRRAWNVLLYHAYEALPTQESHQISIRTLCDLLEYAGNNHEYIKESLRALVGLKVEWNLLNKDGQEIWGIAALLADAEIQDGICTYSYGAQFRKRLYNPRIYARIDLSLQNKFVNKYAQALWELCVDYLGADRPYGETSYIAVEPFRKLMGITEDRYPSMKKLNQRVIRPALTEINRLTDLKVTADYQRQGRKVIGIKFKVQRVLALPSHHTKPSPFFSDLDDMPPLVQALKAAGLASADAWHIWQQGAAMVEAADKPAPDAFDAYIREKIDLLERRQRAGKVESATGFLLAAIKHNYPNPEYQQRGKRRRAQQAKAQAERQAELERRFEAHREQVFWQRFSERPEAWQAEQRERLEAVLQSAPEHRFAWQSYREHGSLKAPSVAGVLMAMLEGELLSQPEERSLEGFAAWLGEV